MKKVVAAALATFAMGTFAAGIAKADTDVFGTQQQIDGTYSLRRTTTEQFDPVRGQSVLDRPRPDFDPTPIPISSFQFFPSLDLGTMTNSNIFATNNHEIGDQVWIVDPTVSLLSNWGRHAVALTANADINSYTLNNEQNFASGTVQAEGRYDIAEQTWLSGTAGYQRETELRGNPTAPGSQASPSQFNLYSATAEANRSVGILHAKADYGFRYYEYSPIELIGGGTASQSTRDRTQQSVTGEVTYVVTENMKPYVAVGYNTRDYLTSGQQNSNGYNIDIGSRMDFGGIVTAQAYIGYLAQNYYNYSSGLVNAVDYGADILWNVTSLTSIEGKANRSIEETTNAGASSFLMSGGSVTVSHELMRNLLLESTVDYYGLDYQKIVQHDNYYDISGGARYFINRNLHTDVTYDYQRHNSTAQGADFDKHTLLLRLGMQY